MANDSDNYILAKPILIHFKFGKPFKTAKKRNDGAKILKKLTNKIFVKKVTI